MDRQKVIKLFENIRNFALENGFKIRYSKQYLNSILLSDATELENIFLELIEVMELMIEKKESLFIEL